MKANLLNFTAIDLGSSKIAAVATHIDKKGNTKLLSYNLHHALGIRSGIITDLQAAETSIISTIYAIEKECNKNIKEVTVSLSGADTKSHYCYNKLKISEQQVKTQDIQKLLQKMLSEFKIKGQEVIHYFPMEFVIDDRYPVENPIGMFGKEISCRLHIVTATSYLLTNIANCLARCQIEVKTFFLSVYAAGFACLSTEEKSLGSMVIDLGANITSIGIFFSNKLIYSSYITIGSWSITNDIAKVFSINISTAERLKILYGSAVLLPFEKNIPISIEEFEDDNQYNPHMVITIGQLTSVINSRIEEIICMIKEHCNQAEIDHSIARRIILTGGGAALKSIKELTTAIFEKPVRIGKPIDLLETTEIPNSGAYSTAIGMVSHHACTQQKNYLDLYNANENNSWLMKALIWIKTNI